VPELREFDQFRARDEFDGTLGEINAEFHATRSLPRPLFNPASICTHGS
jgi:hypothetical protein